MTEYLSISALTKYIKTKFERDPYLETVFIKAELSNVKHHTSGAVYFTLKDGSAVMNAVMFNNNARKLTFKPKDGDQVLITGRISVYEARGSYQLYANEITLDGIGQLYERFEQLKKTFLQKGYFDASHKKPIPKYPAKIAVLTASTGAAIRDIQSTLSRRYPLAEVEYISTLVQGTQAAPDIVKNIRLADQDNFDVIIVGRGGGSIEDLWAFNEESVVQAIFEAQTPIISAVGHETDTTLSDYVADLRAPTPTAAAELATPNTIDLMNKLQQSEIFMRQKLTQHIRYERERLSRFQNHALLKNPIRIIEDKQQRLDDIERQLLNLLRLKYSSYNERFIRLDGKLSSERLRSLISLNNERLNAIHIRINNHMKHQQHVKSDQLASQMKLLNSLNPTGILARGYSIVRNENGIITSIDQVNKDMQLQIQLSDGLVDAAVVDTKERN